MADGVTQLLTRVSAGDASALAGLLEPQSSGSAPASALTDPAPAVAGPPARQTAIDGEESVYLPIAKR